MGELLPHQIPPPQPWEGWLIQAGRGSGKTAGVADYVTKHIEGEPCLPGRMPHRMALIAPTIGDAVESADRHPICLTSLRPEAKLQQKAGGTIVSWPNGSEMKLFGVHTRDDVDRLRAGGNNCLAWLEEVAAWRYLTDGYDQIQFGLRAGPHPHWVGSTTPKPYPEYVKISEEPGVVVVGASTYDNPHLAAKFRERIMRRYSGTTLAAQEIEGKIIDQVEGAHWKMVWIEENRVHQTPTMTRVVVGVDPSGGRAQAGIVAAGLVTRDCTCGLDAPYPHAIVLGDFTTDGDPDEWGQGSVKAFDAVQADRIVGERNYGGDMVEKIIRSVRPGIAYGDVQATRGKSVRAEPIVALYQQRRIHHLGRFPELESEQVTWVADESPWSPNRLDAAVWALTELGLHKNTESSISGRRVAERRI